MGYIHYVENFLTTILFKQHENFIDFYTKPEWNVLTSRGIVIIFPQLVELITGYKMILNYRNNNVVLKIFSLQDFTKAMENSYIATIICLTHAYFSLGQKKFFRAAKTCLEVHKDSISHEGITLSFSTLSPWSPWTH